MGLALGPPVQVSVSLLARPGASHPLGMVCVAYTRGTASLWEIEVGKLLGKQREDTGNLWGNNLET